GDEQRGHVHVPDGARPPPGATLLAARVREELLVGGDVPAVVGHPVRHRVVVLLLQAGGGRPPAHHLVVADGREQRRVRQQRRSPVGAPGDGVPAPAGQYREERPAATAVEPVARPVRVVDQVAGGEHTVQFGTGDRGHRLDVRRGQVVELVVAGQQQAYAPAGRDGRRQGVRG